MRDKEESLTFPGSDTLPGPGIYEAKVGLGFEEFGEIEELNLSKEELDEYGHGAAQDIPSTNRTPDTFDNEYS